MNVAIPIVVAEHIGSRREGEFAAVGRPCGVVVIAFIKGELFPVGSVGVHDADVTGEVVGVYSPVPDDAVAVR